MKMNSILKRTREYQWTVTPSTTTKMRKTGRKTLYMFSIYTWGGERGERAVGLHRQNQFLQSLSQHPPPSLSLATLQILLDFSFRSICDLLGFSLESYLPTNPRILRALIFLQKMAGNNQISDDKDELNARCRRG